MPKSDDGSNPGEDDDATKQSDKKKNGNAAGNAGGKSVTDDDDDEGGDGDGKPKNGRFYTQAELDELITRRVNRATKKITEDAKLSETERLERERDEALTQVRERDLRDEFIAAAGLDYSKGLKFFRMYRPDIDTDDKGKALNLKDVIAEFKKDFPDVAGDKQRKPAGKGKADAGSGNGNDGQAAGDDMNSMLRRATGRNF